MTGLDLESPEEIARYLSEVRAARDQKPEQAARQWLEDPLMAPAMENPKLAPRLERLARENLHAWLNNWKLQRIPQPPTAQRLGEIKVPTLLIVGDRDVRGVLAMVDTLAKSIAGARRVVIPGAGHMVNMEKPAEFDRAVLEFLRGVAKGRRP